MNKNNLSVYGEYSLWLEKIIYNLPDSAEWETMCSLNMWVGIETQKYDIHSTTCNVNFFVYFYLYMILLLVLCRLRYLSLKYIKGLKTRPLEKFALFCVIHFYVTPTQLFWTLWRVFLELLTPGKPRKLDNTFKGIQNTSPWKPDNPL